MSQFVLLPNIKKRRIQIVTSCIAMLILPEYSTGSPTHTLNYGSMRNQRLQITNEKESSNFACIFLKSNNLLNIFELLAKRDTTTVIIEREQFPGAFRTCLEKGSRKKESCESKYGSRCTWTCVYVCACERESKTKAKTSITKQCYKTEGFSDPNKTH